MQELRDYYGKPVTITGPNRCKAQNDRTAGAMPGSQHLYGRACDFVVAGVRPDEVQAYLTMKYGNKFGIGRYSDRTHFDSRSGPPARWDLT